MNARDAVDAAVVAYVDMLVCTCLNPVVALTLLLSVWLGGSISFVPTRGCFVFNRLFCPYRCPRSRQQAPAAAYTYTQQPTAPPYNTGYGGAPQANQYYSAPAAAAPAPVQAEATHTSTGYGTTKRR